MRLPFSISQAVMLGLLGSSTLVHASGFALIEQSASGQGLSYAGAAASTEDASVMWFNPAGMTELAGSQAILGLHVISPKAKFTDLSGSGDDGATVGYVPNLYWKGQFGEYAVGLGFNVPFGQHISYDENWVGKYHATETDLKSYNLNPSIARKINEKLSFGLGLNAQYVDVVLEQKINQTAIGDTNPANAKVTGNSWAYGYNLGLMLKPVESMNIGLSYRSAITHDVKGKVDYTGVNSTISIPSFGAAKLNQVLYDAGATASVNLPASASLAMDYQVSPKIQVLASSTWTGWKAYDELVVDFANKSPDSESNQNFKDSMRYALGMIYKLNDAWKLRTGLALDETPVPDKYSRSPRTPDSDRKWISVGVGYQITPKMNIDIAYSRLFADLSDVEYINYSSLGNTTLKGSYDSSVDIFSAQLVWQY